MKIRVRTADGHWHNLNLRQPVTSFDYPDGVSVLKSTDENGTEYNYNFDTNGYYTGKTGVLGNALTEPQIVDITQEPQELS